jgi:predicted enzyme related to lactoylglutathione lyase
MTSGPIAHRRSMALTTLFAGIPVRDYEAALDWYERFAGRPPDLVPHAGEAAWQVAGAAWLCVMRDAERAGTAVHTLLVDDLEERIAELARRGIASGPIEDVVAGSVRRAVVVDPEGTRISLGEVAG